MSSEPYASAWTRSAPLPSRAAPRPRGAGLRAGRADRRVLLEPGDLLLRRAAGRLRGGPGQRERSRSGSFGKRTRAAERRLTTCLGRLGLQGTLPHREPHLDGGKMRFLSMVAGIALVVSMLSVCMSGPASPRISDPCGPDLRLARTSRPGYGPALWVPGETDPRRSVLGAGQRGGPSSQRSRNVTHPPNRRVSRLGKETG
jgi:hypothetical protein